MTIVITLAAGTGLNAAVLALGLRHPAPAASLPDADRLVLIEQEIKWGQLQDWKARLQTVDDASGPSRRRVTSCAGSERPRVVKAAFVSDNFFDLCSALREPASRRSTGQRTGAVSSSANGPRRRSRAQSARSAHTRVGCRC